MLSTRLRILANAVSREVAQKCPCLAFRVAPDNRSVQDCLSAANDSPSSIRGEALIRPNASAMVAFIVRQNEHWIDKMVLAQRSEAM